MLVPIVSGNESGGARELAKAACFSNKQLVIVSPIDVLNQVFHGIEHLGDDTINTFVNRWAGNPSNSLCFHFFECKSKLDFYVLILYIVCQITIGYYYDIYDYYN